jgi:Domain of unknown function (DUF4136)
MKSIPLLLLAVGAVALTGCSSVTTEVNTGAIRARTFNFVNVGSRPAPDYADNNQALHAMIQNAITSNLAARGVSRVGAGGDITVAYLVITGNNATTARINDYFGYRDDLDALHEKAHEVYTGGQNPNHFEAGTLLIDIIDGKTFKLLKRGHATRPRGGDPSPGSRAARIQGVVDEILRSVRIAR